MPFQGRPMPVQLAPVNSCARLSIVSRTRSVRPRYQLAQTRTNITRVKSIVPVWVIAVFGGVGLNPLTGECPAVNLPRWPVRGGFDDRFLDLFALLGRAGRVLKGRKGSRNVVSSDEPISVDAYAACFGKG